MSSPSSRHGAIADGTSAGLIFLAGPVAGYFLGKWLGQWLGWGPGPAYVGGALGLAAAFVNFFRLARRLFR